MKTYSLALALFIVGLTDTSVNAINNRNRGILDRAIANIKIEENAKLTQ